MKLWRQQRGLRMRSAGEEDGFSGAFTRIAGAPTPALSDDDGARKRGWRHRWWRQSKLAARDDADHGELTCRLSQRGTAPPSPSLSLSLEHRNVWSVLAPRLLSVSLPELGLPSRGSRATDRSQALELKREGRTEHMTGRAVAMTVVRWFGLPAVIFARTD